MTRRRAAALVLGACLLAGCGGDDGTGQVAVPSSAGETVARPSTSTSTSTSSTTTTAAPSTTSTVAACPPVTLVVFGNSIDAELDPALPPWPVRMEAILRSEPAWADLDVVDRATPGSMIVGPNLFDDGPMALLVTAIPEVLAGYTPAERARLVVVIAPSFAEVSDIHSGEPDDVLVTRAVMGVQLSVDLARGEGVGGVVVLPMNPVSDVAEYLQGYPINDRISAVNAELERLGITPPSMPRSPLLDTQTGKGDWRYFDDFVSTGPYMVGSADGVHPDEDGHTLLARATADLPELGQVLARLC